PPPPGHRVWSLQRHRLKPPNQPFEASKHPEFSINTLYNYRGNPANPIALNSTNDVCQCPPITDNVCQ
ncbi:MAG: hypothetical protein K2O54_07395, partial [Prevotella sp.]|nr:hypothetical protein [Prevotella sp.]